VTKVAQQCVLDLALDAARPVDGQAGRFPLIGMIAIAQKKAGVPADQAYAS
jgi:hypothetical protein